MSWLTVSVVLFNFAANIAYALADPRIRLVGREVA